MEIRRALATDTAALTRIAHAAKRHWGYPEGWIALWKDALTVTPQALERQAVYCAVEGTELLGFCAVAGGGPTRELEHLWVAPEHMGAGVGRRLLRHALDAIRASGGATLRIASDPNAEGFYLKMGARRIGELPSQPEGRSLPLLLLEVG
jgi:ribosomal protein S18 acetylase RimI-like enzyme